MQKVQWIDCTLGQLLATIGGDNKIKLWREDPSRAHIRGRRFKCIFSQAPSNNVAYVAFDYITRDQDLYLALMSHTGLLTLMVPTDPTSLSSWRDVDAFYPFDQQTRGSEPRFSISFHQAAGPSAQALLAGLDPDAMSLAISTASSLKVFRATKHEEENYHLQEVVEIPIEVTLINSIAWAPGCNQPNDIIALACDDSTVRLLEITVQKPPASILSTRSQSAQPSMRRDSANLRTAPSGITAGLAGIDRSREARIGVKGINLKHGGQEIAMLEHDEGGSVSRVKWNIDGSYCRIEAHEVKLTVCREFARLIGQR